MAFLSKYTGKQVEEQLDKISGLEIDKEYLSNRETSIPSSKAVKNYAFTEIYFWKVIESEIKVIDEDIDDNDIYSTIYSSQLNRFLFESGGKYYTKWAGCEIYGVITDKGVQPKFNTLYIALEANDDDMCFLYVKDELKPICLDLKKAIEEQLDSRYTRFITFGWITNEDITPINEFCEEECPAVDSVIYSYKNRAFLYAFADDNGGYKYYTKWKGCETFGTSTYYGVVPPQNTLFLCDGRPEIGSLGGYYVSWGKFYRLPIELTISQTINESDKDVPSCKAVKDYLNNGKFARIVTFGRTIENSVEYVNEYIDEGSYSNIIYSFANNSFYYQSGDKYYTKWATAERYGEITDKGVFPIDSILYFNDYRETLMLYNSPNCILQGLQISTEDLPDYSYIDADCYDINIQVNSDADENNYRANLGQLLDWGYYPNLRHNMIQNHDFVLEFGEISDKEIVPTGGYIDENIAANIVYSPLVNRFFYRKDGKYYTNWKDSRYYGTHDNKIKGIYPYSHNTYFEISSDQWYKAPVDDTLRLLPTGPELKKFTQELFIDMWENLSIKFDHIKFIYDRKTSKFGFKWDDSAPAVFKEYEIKDVSYEDALTIYKSQIYAMKLPYRAYKNIPRFNIPPYTYCTSMEGTGIEIASQAFIQMENLEVLLLSDNYSETEYLINGTINITSGNAPNLKAILGSVTVAPMAVSATTSTKIVLQTPKLEVLFLSGLGGIQGWTDIDISNCPDIRIESFQFMVDRAYGGEVRFKVPKAIMAKLYDDDETSPWVQLYHQANLKNIFFDV